jgi:histidinol-phosphate aminotransferase
MNYERDNIGRLHAYTPGEQPQVSRVVKLNTNENPFPPAPGVMEAIRAVQGESLRRYPPPSAARFRETAARIHGLTPQQVMATNGGDELLRMVISVFCRPVQTSPPIPCAAGVDGGLGVESPTYSLYGVLASIHDTPVTHIPLNADWTIPDDFAARLINAGCRVAIIVNPHAPSGRLEPLEKIRSIAKALQGHCVLLIDEAYVDFAEFDALPLLAPDSGLDNVLLLRTLSKGYALAGLRFGYALGHPNLIAAMDKARDSYNTDYLSQVAAVAALENREYSRQGWKKVLAERSRLSSALEDIGFTVLPSQTNFILATPPGERVVGTTQPTARAIYESLKAQGIFVRYFDQDRLRDKLRITIGTAEENDQLLAALKAM